MERSATASDPGSAASGTTPLPVDVAKRAIGERRLIWLSYRSLDGRVMEGPVEIYHVTKKGTIRGWCRTQRCRSTFQRNQILAWQILDERFQPVRNMEEWAEREARTAWIGRLKELWQQAKEKLSGL